MQFVDSTQRNDYFERIDAGQFLPELGSAIEHAATTQLGLWADSAALKLDCAKIMVAELRRYSQEHKLSFADRFFSVKLILQSDAFTRAFRAARILPDGRTHNEIARLIQGQVADHREEMNDAERESLLNLHEKILHEFKSVYPVTAREFNRACYPGQL